MIYFVEGRDEEFNRSLDDLQAAISHHSSIKRVSLKRNNFSGSMHRVVAEISDVQHCIECGVDPHRIIGIGYSRSSYYGKPTIEGIHQHYVTHRSYSSSGIVMPFGYTLDRGIKEICMPKVIGLHAEFMPPHLKDLKEYSYLYEPNDDREYDVLVYASNNDRYLRSLRRAVASGIPIIGYRSVPMIADLIDDGLAFELHEDDDFENALTNTLTYIGSNPHWQLHNSLRLFERAKKHMNWDVWIDEFKSL